MTRNSFRKLSFILTAVVLSGTLYLSTTYATLAPLTPPPLGGYDAGTNSILDPGCGPTDTDCFVKEFQGWKLTGNAGTDGGITNFIGTTDAQDFMVKTNGNQIALFGQNGNVAIGSANSNLGVVAPVASGVNSFSAGTGSIASGDYSVAIGQSNIASGQNALAFGQITTASNYLAAAFGQQTQATGSVSTAFGSFSNASGVNSTAFGQSSTASGNLATVFGRYNTASSFAETVFGYSASNYTPNNISNADNADRLFVIGNGVGSFNNNAYTLWKDGSFAYNDDNFQNDNPATEQNMFYFNYGNHDGLGGAQIKRAIRLGSALNGEWDINSANVGDRSIAIGFDDSGGGGSPRASGMDSVALGFAAVASGPYSLAGNYGTASGDSASAFSGGIASGFTSFAAATASALGDYSFGAGTGVRAQSFSEAALGMYSTSYTPVSTTAARLTDRIFNIGNGDNDSLNTTMGLWPDRSDAFTILKNGKTGIGYNNFETTTFDSLLQVNGSILSSAITGCLFLSTDADGKITCSSGSGFIPLSGTTPGNLVTGSIEVHSGDTFDVGNGRTIYAVASGDPDITAGFSLQDDSDLMPALWRKDHGTITSLVIKNGSVEIDAPDHNTEIFFVTGKIRIGDPNISIGAVATFENTTGSCTINPTTTSLNCSSDERLKKNIEDITNDTLNTLINVKTVKYNWNSELNSEAKHVGFIAQNLIQFYPELVSESDGYYQVNYAGMTPILVEAIREMNLKITDINNVTVTNTWRDALISWFGNVENGIQRIFTKTIRVQNGVEMIDHATGEVYCTFIENGEFKKVIGECTDSISTTPPSVAPIVSPDPVIDLPVVNPESNPGIAPDPVVTAPETSAVSDPVPPSPDSEPTTSTE